MPLLSVLVLLLVCGTSDAHVDNASSAIADPWHWTFEPWVMTLLMLSLALYAAGAWQLFSRSTHRIDLVRRSLWFGGGWLVLVAALVSPIDALGTHLFSAHMVQHELLMIVAAPLLVFGKPLAIWLWAFPESIRGAFGRIARSAPIGAAWHALTRAPVAWLIHALALWLWHVPSFFEAALNDNSIHTLQHSCFLVTALFFWWAVVSGSAHQSSRAIVYLFTTMIHTGALGALLTFSGSVWYESYASRASTLGFDALTDQQLGGLIMWIPGGLVYVLAGLALSIRWLALDKPVSLSRPEPRGTADSRG